VDHEIIRIGSGGRPAAEYPARLPALRILDLDNFGTKLGESLGAGWSRLELREIENLYIIQTMRRYTRCIHRSSLRLNNLDR
jgi:hypothetical protein